HLPRGFRVRRVWERVGERAAPLVVRGDEPLERREPLVGRDEAAARHLQPPLGYEFLDARRYVLRGGGIRHELGEERHVAQHESPRRLLLQRDEHSSVNLFPIHGVSIVRLPPPRVMVAVWHHVHARRQSRARRAAERRPCPLTSSRAL
ncbi:hypothetical protein T484DRAFT_1990176, partial [Baffinella frigidus]